MVDSTLPDQRETVCEDWGEANMWAYAPRILENASHYVDPLEIFWTIDREVQFQPEYFYSHFEENKSVTCPYGSKFTFGPSEVEDAYTFDNCAYTQGSALIGTGSHDYGTGLLIIDAQVSGDKSSILTYTHNYNIDSISVTGGYGGETIDMQN